MRIYLDSNVFRDLKKPENKALYELILKDRERNYYYFSEAHIQDLVQDNSDRKLLDMDFMETIVADNCWYYDKGLKVQFCSPRMYYGDYQWGTGTDLMTAEDSIYVLIRETFRAIPLDLGSLINQNDLPVDFPEDLRPMLLESTTMLDFMEAMLDLTENLSSEQSRFKRLLQYLHRSFGGNVMYEKIGIRGYDGITFTNWEAFAESFKDLVYQRSHEKDLYNQFTDMQYALDIYGIVKGKPKKQKFMSLLNDGKHAFYAGHAHLLVTNDVDMIAKTKLIYKVWGIETEVITPDELNQHLINISLKDDGVASLFEQFNRAVELTNVYEKYSLDETFVKKDLAFWYLGEYNTLNCATARGNTYYYFSQDFSKIPSYTLTVELERIVNKLSEHFGVDELGRSKFDRKELESKDWKGREWRAGEMGVIFRINQGMTISFFKAAPPLENQNSAQQ
jgi:hypothetical protein